MTGRTYIDCGGPTIDWMMDGLEVGGCSQRKDWEHGDVYEIAIGLDRLVAKLLS